MNTSATGGYLTPSSSPAPLEGAAVVNFIQAWVVGITGMQGKNVRPRWQPEPPNIPLDGIDWAAFGIVRREIQLYAAEKFIATEDGGYSQIINHEIMHMLISFYGDNADLNAHLLREGMQLSQNREVLSLNNMGLVDCGEVVALPELLKEKWLYRVDLPFAIRRQIVRDYPVLSILSGDIQLDNEHYITDIEVKQ